MLRASWRLLRPREKLAAICIATASLVSSAVELAALSTVVPFVSLLIDPAALDRYPFIRTTALRFGFADRYDLFLALGIGVIASLIAGFAFRMTVYFLVERFSMRLTNRLSSETLYGCLSAPYSWLRSQNGTRLAQRIALDIPHAGQHLYPVALDLLYGFFILMVGTAAILAASSWQAIIVIFGIGAVGLIVLLFLNPLATRMAARVRGHALAGNQNAVEIFAGRKLIKASQSEGFFNDKYRSVFEHGTAARMILNLVSRATPNSTLVIGQVGIIILALVFILSDVAFDALVTQLAFILLVLTRVLPAVSTMASSINRLVNVGPFFRGLISLRAELAPWTIDQSFAKKLHAGSTFVDWRHVTLTDVKFRYNLDGEPQIRGINVTLIRGQHIGIAGPSGAGKSTLVDLILGLLFPDHGRILIDDQLLDDSNRTKWLTMIGYVPQEPYVMDDSLRRNIAFGVVDTAIDDHRVWSALEQAHLEELVCGWPDGLDTGLGEGGSKLSGGQRQRVAIARALYRGATILVLDEATNALDAEAEKSVTKTAHEIPGLTSIMIAHRLTALRECDRILLVDDGRLVADDRFSDLINTNTLFSRLVHNIGHSSEHEVVPEN